MFQFVEETSMDSPSACYIPMDVATTSTARKPTFSASVSQIRDQSETNSHPYSRKNK